jgi:hypothetical protein
MLRKFVLLSFVFGVAHAEDMIDPSLISPIDCPTPVVRLEPKITPITNFGFQHSDKYSLDTVHVNTYTLVEVDGVMYKKYMIFSDNKWTDELIRK